MAAGRSARTLHLPPLRGVLDLLLFVGNTLLTNTFLLSSVFGENKFEEGRGCGKYDVY